MKRKIVLTILAAEGIGGIFGGLLLALSPDGHIMDMSPEIMHGVFPNFLLPSLILTCMGILTLSAFFSVLRKSKNDWIMAGLALVGFTIWFTTEIIILQEVHWLHIVWGVPVLIGLWAAYPLIPIGIRQHIY